MEEKKIVPKRRYQGFKEKWVKSKLENLASFSKGKGYSKKDLTDVGHQLILYGRLYTNYETVIQNVDTYTIKQENSMLSKGREVIIPSSGETKVDIARASAVLEPNIIIGGDLNVIIPSKELDSVFLALNISNGSCQKELMKRAQGSSVVHLYNEDLISITLPFPNVKEQQKIGDFFKVLDERIANQERKIAKVKALKSAYLTEVFPQEGETVPKRRFNGFEEEWIKKEVGEVFQITRGKVLSTTKIKKKKSKIACYPVYSSQTQNNGLLGYYSDFLFDTAITWTTDGANAGTVKYREGKFYSTNVNGVLVSKDGYSCRAMAELLNLEAWKHVSKVGNPKLMSNVMSSIEILIPQSTKELDKLSMFFKNLDDQIEMEEKKLDKLKKMKKAYLKEMFV